MHAKRSTRSKSYRIFFFREIFSGAVLVASTRREGLRLISGSQQMTPETRMVFGDHSRCIRCEKSLCGKNIRYMLSPRGNLAWHPRPSATRSGASIPQAVLTYPRVLLIQPFPSIELTIARPIHCSFATTRYANGDASPRIHFWERLGTRVSTMSLSSTR